MTVMASGISFKGIGPRSRRSSLPRARLPINDLVLMASQRLLLRDDVTSYTMVAGRPCKPGEEVAMAMAMMAEASRTATKVIEGLVPSFERITTLMQEFLEKMMELGIVDPAEWDEEEA